MKINQKEIEGLKKTVRAANYLAVAQIYLNENVFLERELKHDDIKPRLLGHWGTCAGINFVYAQIHRMIKKTGKPFMYVVGPGHGFPAVQANLFLEGSLSNFYEEIPYSKKGLHEICHNFSAPYGYPSHANPGAPGIVLEGGELGYSLSMAYGTVLDNPELITVCLVGDGEAETGPSAAAWQINKLLSPKENGAVLPVLHVNGYKISGPTVFGRMSDTEIQKYFEGLGYEPLFVSNGKEIYEKMTETMEVAYKKIRKVQKSARSGKKINKPKWPVIILRTPKGWTGPKWDGKTKLEGNCKAHQVVYGDAKKNPKSLKVIEKWLRSYKIDELISEKNGKLVLDKDIQSLLPKKGMTTGTQKLAFGGDVVRDLDLPIVSKLCKKISKRGKTDESPMRAVGEYLREVFGSRKNKSKFRFFSPDETTSNRLDAIYEKTNRSWVWPSMKWDDFNDTSGGAMELLSEHTLFGLLKGYTMTGRHGVFTSYESFMQVVASMADQYAKFVKASLEVDFRKPLPALNVILTSLLERQDHNGFSHQNPSFIASMLEKDGGIISAYLPPDANSARYAIDRMLRERNKLNIMVAGKQPILPIYLKPSEAKKQMEDGIMTWDFVSDKNPDLVLAASGDYVTKETLAAMEIIRNEFKDIKLRFVSVSELTSLGVGNPHKVDSDEYDDYFTSDKPVVFNFHGYAQTIKKLMFDYISHERMIVRGYREEGSTTSPFDMQTRNGTSRYNIALDVIIQLEKRGVISRSKAQKFEEMIFKKLGEHMGYILEYGDDPEEIKGWRLS